VIASPRTDPATNDKARRRPRGFSLLEMLIAMAISGALLSATLAALDSVFKHYRSTTESASTHVVSRIMMHRMLAMIRTGDEFGPAPTDVFDPLENPQLSNFIEFVSSRDLDGGVARVTRIEYRPAPAGNDPGEGEIWYMLLDAGPTASVLEERPLLTGVRDALFTLRFDERTWRMEQATLDITVEPNDSEDLQLAAETAPQTIRLVASAAPRQLD